MLAVYLAVVAAIGYLLGGLNGAIVTSRLVYREDIRKRGSGNPGLTNFCRNYGRQAVFLLVLIDILKTALPVVLGGMLLEQYAAFGTVTDRILIGRLLGGFFAMLGHAYPLYHKFRGGKCVLAAGTLVFFVDLRITAIVFAIFLLAVLMSRYVSLGSILASLSFPIAMLALGYGALPFVITACCFLLILYRHRENLVRLARGEESKFQMKRHTDDGNGGGQA